VGVTEVGLGAEGGMVVLGADAGVDEGAVSVVGARVTGLGVGEDVTGVGLGAVGGVIAGAVLGERVPGVESVGASVLEVDGGAARVETRVLGGVVGAGSVESRGEEEVLGWAHPFPWAREVDGPLWG